MNEKEMVLKAMDGDEEAKKELFIAGKKAFRIAWEFCSSHLMPQSDPEWWIQAAKDMAAIGDQGNLTAELIVAVYANLEWMVKGKEAVLKRGEKDEE